MHVLGATQSKQTYLKMFKSAKPQHRYLGEGTTHYLSDINAAENIAKKSPNAKIIAVIRNPIERAHSAYLLLGRRGENEMTFYNTMTEHIKSVDDPNRSFGNFALQGLYTKQLKNFYEHFPKQQILVLSFEDLKNDQAKVVDQIAKFLELSNKGFEAQKKAKNTHKQPRGALTKTILRNKSLTRHASKILPKKLISEVRDNLLLKKQPKQAIDKKSRELLESFFADELKNFDKNISNET
jgi:hypothetical protein